MIACVSRSTRKVSEFGNVIRSGGGSIRDGTRFFAPAEMIDKNLGGGGLNKAYSADDVCSYGLRQGS